MIAVESVEIIDVEEDVYDITVDVDESFIVGGVVVHNCPICRPYSGQAWTLDGKRLPGTKLSYPGPPPIHPQCRCQVLVILRAYRDLSKAKGPRFEAAVKALPQETQDALDGSLGVDLSLPVWLKQQPEATQRDVLGPSRLKLWQQGKLPLTAMVSAATGRVLTLEQLKARRRRKVA
jgi:hypothetical protein